MSQRPFGFSFTSGGLINVESTTMADVYLDIGDWDETEATFGALDLTGAPARNLSLVMIQ